ncbi:hypothetical protein QR685DRAFT_554537 [Neurospora intermedia]|uniref:Secreted protein n=1 Tax=Neurospora intermedia TaxID=5142 RepID=A0ABR3DAM9_NEUIN
MVAAFAAAAAREFLRLAFGRATRLGRLAAQLWGIIAQRVQPLTTTTTTAATTTNAAAVAPAPGGSAPRRPRALVFAGPNGPKPGPGSGPSSSPGWSGRCAYPSPISCLVACLVAGPVAAAAAAAACPVAACPVAASLAWSFCSPGFPRAPAAVRPPAAAQLAGSGFPGP